MVLRSRDDAAVQDSPADENFARHASRFFGWSSERRLERQLRADYEKLLDEIAED